MQPFDLWIWHAFSLSNCAAPYAHVPQGAGKIHACHNGKLTRNPESLSQTAALRGVQAAAPSGRQRRHPRVMRHHVVPAGNLRWASLISSDASSSCWLMRATHGCNHPVTGMPAGGPAALALAICCGKIMPVPVRIPYSEWTV